jgi:hypothetical protein
MVTVPTNCAFGYVFVRPSGLANDVALGFCEAGVVHCTRVPIRSIRILAKVLNDIADGAEEAVFGERGRP